jgi:membrane protein
MNASERWTDARSFLREDLWRREFEPRTWAARGAAALQFAVMVGEGFVRDQLLLRASALTYFTVLALVPLLAIVSSVLTALGVTENVVGRIIEQFAAGAPEAAAWIEDFVANADLAGLGGLGGVFLFLTTVAGVTNIEKALNHIWGVKQVRPWARRLPDYLAVLIIAPLLLGAGISLATTLRSQWIVRQMLEFPGFELLYHLGLRQLPMLVLAGAFSFLYWFLPNTSVRAAGALLGGVVAAVLVNGAIAVYLGLSVGAARASALYGSFAALPLLFVWIYFFWAIVLFGAEIAFAYQNLPLYRREVRGRRAGPLEREAIGLRIALEIGRRFRDGTSPWTADGLADALRVPVRTVRSVLQALSEAHIVAALDGSEHGDGYQLGRPAERIAIIDVLSALRGPRQTMGGDREVRTAVEAVLGQLREGEAGAAGGQTLADVLERISAAGPAPEASG